MVQKYFFIALAATALLAPNTHTMHLELKKKRITYKDQERTPKNKGILAPKISQENNDIQEFINKNSSFLEDLASNPKKLVNYKQKIAHDKQLVEELKLEQQSIHSNYIFKVPGNDFYVQISGLFNRIPGLKNAAGLAPHYVKDEDYTVLFNEETQKNESTLLPTLFEKLTDKLGETLTPTYQTVSRVANYLCLTETVEKENLQCVKTMPTYLAHIPTRPELVCDENYVVVQEKLPEGLYPIDKRSEKLDKNNVVQLFKAITQSGTLFNVDGNLYVNEDGTLFITDLEQPNYSDPNLFYYQDGRDSKEFRHNVCCGIMGFNNILKQHAPHLAGIVKMLLINHSELNNKENPKYPEYKKEIIDTL